MSKVLILLDLPSDYILQSKFVLEYFSLSWGICIEVTMDPAELNIAQVIYTSDTEKRSDKDRQILIPFDVLLYDPTSICYSTHVDGRPVWTRQGSDPSEIDLIASTFRLLTLLDEQQIVPSARDYLGNFLVEDLPSGRQATIDVPLADNHASLLLERLLKIVPRLSETILPRWPEGKKYAICVSHDCDAMHRGHPREIITALGKWLVRRKRVYWDLAREGFNYRHSPMTNPSWGFNGWREFESKRDIRSCFYLAVRPLRCRRMLNDCKSDALVAGVDWQVFREMRAQGWEFGLHPSLNAKGDKEELSLEKRALEDLLEAPINGVRHHYLAIDNINPHLTFKKHVSAGINYDSSLGWQEKAGFRTGTALPSQPFDPETGRLLNLLELPLILMDTYIMRGDASQAVQSSLKIADTVRKSGGVLTINWHTEAYCNRLLFTNYLNVFDDIITPLLADQSVWFTTPGKIDAWWRSRIGALQCS